MRRTVELKLRVMDVAVINAVFAMPLYRRVQVDRVTVAAMAESEPAPPVQSVASPKYHDNATNCAIARSKACKRCGAIKPLTEFHLSDSERNKRRAVCKPCMKARVLAGRSAAPVQREHPDDIRVAQPRQGYIRLDENDRPEGKLKSLTDIDRRGIVHRGPVSDVIANYLRAVS
jgi:hypothetical protein